MTTALPVLVVGATGSLGGKVVDELLGRGKNVRALVRPTTDASRLESRGVEIARGDMLDLDSLVAAMNDADAVITTAAGYTRGGKNAHDIDTLGNANLAEATHRTGIRRFVLTSILTSDQTPHVPTSGTRSSPRTNSNSSASRSSHCGRGPSSTRSRPWRATRSTRAA
ncbi:NAD(P)H-binding protein [Streptomyces canus]|uniref:NAD(P)H-binding protein n=1 Tax=Streptomyces canus TaxID=58343 RepID=UPI0036E97653